MTRKRYPEDKEQPDRWLVSYADFITLLFAFFVVMYAVSSVQQHKVRQLSQSIGQALGKKQTAAASPITMARPDELASARLAERRQAKAQHEQAQMTAMAQALDGKLSTLVQEGKVRVTRTGRGITIEINAAILFAPANADLNPASIAALQSIAQVLQSYSQAIEIIGHTDNRAIETARYPSNWELSAARASRVVRLLIDTGIDEKRLLAVGNADTHPVASNDTMEGRLRNRRVEIVIVSKESSVGKADEALDD